MKQLEIETDEANGVEEKEFRALLDGLKKKMRAEGCSVKDTAQRLSDLKAQKVLPL